MLDCHAMKKTGTQIKHGGRHIVPRNFLICERCTVVNNHLCVMGRHNCEICILLGQVVMLKKMTVL